MSFLHLTPPRALDLLPLVSGVSGQRHSELPLPDRAERRALLQGRRHIALAGYENWQINSAPMLPGGAVLIGLREGGAGQPTSLLGVATTEYGKHGLLAALELIHVRHYEQQVARVGHGIGDQWLSPPKMPAQLPWLSLAIAPDVADSAEQTGRLVELAWVMGLCALAEADLFAH